MKKDSLAIDGKIYLSSKRAAEIAGYSKDYIGQLCRSGKLICRTVGRLWYVDEMSLRKHQSESFKANQTSFRPAGFTSKSLSKTARFTAGPFSIPADISGSFSDDNVSAGIPNPILRHQIFAYSFRRTLILLSIIIVVMAGGITAVSISKPFLPQAFSQSVANNSASVYSAMSTAGGILRSAFDQAYSNIASIISPSAPSSQSTLLGSSVPPTSTNEINQPSNYSVAHAGLVVIPQSASTTSANNTKLVQTITNSFSDNVMITPGPNGTTGVITPEFRTVKGHDFLYVLVPVKTSSSSPTSTPSQNN